MKNTHLFLDVVIHLVLIHLSHVAKEQDLGTRSDCHSNVPEIKAVFLNLFIYLLSILLVSVVSLVSVVPFRRFHFSCFVSSFWFYYMPKEGNSSRRIMRLVPVFII